MDTEVVALFDTTPGILPLYETLEERIRSTYDDVYIKVGKTQVSFYNTHGFAWVSPPWRKMKGWPECFLLVSFGLDHEVKDPRIIQAVEPYPNHWTHHVIVQNSEEIDDELMNWIDESYRFSLGKRGSAAGTKAKSDGSLRKITPMTGADMTNANSPTTDASHADTPQTIDEYIDGFEGDAHDRMVKLRELIHGCSPAIGEKIAYGMPTFTLHGNLVHFAGAKHHIGFYPTPSAVVHFADEITEYKHSKGAVQFPYSKPIPYDLIRDMVLFRIREQESK